MPPNEPPEDPSYKSKGVSLRAAFFVMVVMFVIIVIILLITAQVEPNQYQG